MNRRSLKAAFASCFAVGLMVNGLGAVAQAQTVPPDQQEAVCTDPNVFFCENFEDRSATNVADLSRSKYKNAGWAMSQTGGSLAVTATQAVDGNHSLQLTYEDKSTGPGFMDTGFPASVRTIYLRWYTKWSQNWVWSPVATKHMETVRGSAGADNHLFWSGASGDGPQFIWGYSPMLLYPQNVNAPSVVIQPNRWYCFEVRITLNSATSASDGYLQGWIDGVMHVEYPNAMLSNQNVSAVSGFFVSGYWNCDGNADCSDPIYSHQRMYRWHDNLVASTARVGCLNEAPQDGPPSAPVNLTVQ